MPIDKYEFWGDNYYQHPPLTDDMIAFAEEVLACRLPAKYIELLRIQNGGYTKGFGFPMSVGTTWSDSHVPLSELSGIVITPTIETAQNILDSAYMIEEWGLPEKQVLLTGDGHWWITLDYRNDQVPSISWIDVECGEDIPVAPTFSDFLEGLMPEEVFDENSMQ